jgi:hypothetical protein
LCSASMSAVERGSGSVALLSSVLSATRWPWRSTWCVKRIVAASRSESSDVLPAQPEQLALAPPTTAARRNSVRHGCSDAAERAGELRRAVDAPLRRAADVRPLAGFEQRDRALAAPAAAPAGELEHPGGDLQDPGDRPLAQALGAQLADERRGVVDADRVQAPAAPARPEVVHDGIAVSIACVAGRNCETCSASQRSEASPNFSFGDGLTCSPPALRPRTASRRVACLGDRVECRRVVGHAPALLARAVAVADLELPVAAAVDVALDARAARGGGNSGLAHRVALRFAACSAGVAHRQLSGP